MRKLFTLTLALLASFSLWATISKGDPSSTFTCGTTTAENSLTFDKVSSNTDTILFSPYQIYNSSVTWASYGVAWTNTSSSSYYKPCKLWQDATGSTDDTKQLNNLYGSNNVLKDNGGSVLYLKVTNCTAFLYSGNRASGNINLRIHNVADGATTTNDKTASHSALSLGKQVITGISASATYLITISTTSTSSTNNIFAEIGFVYPSSPVYSVTYVENGHGEEQTDLTNQTNLPNPLPTLSETGWTFSGWFADNNTFNTSITAGNALTKDTTLYAKWTQTNYKVTYDLDGEYGTTPIEADKHYGDEFTLHDGATGITPPSGKEFAGWHDGTSLYAGGADYTMPAANVTFTAQWLTSHTISYDNLKEQSVSGYPTKYYEGVGIASFEPLSDISGWHFVEWSPASISNTADENMTITAVWQEIFTVTFNTVGGSDIDPVDVLDGESVDEPTAPTRLNYTFQKWQKNGVDYDFSDAVTEDITLDAVWTRNSITGSATENYTADTEHSKEVESASSYTANSFSLKKIDDKPWTIAADKSSATGDGKTFAYAFLPGNTSNSSQGFQLTATKNISSLVVYYTMTDGSFSSKDQSKSGNFTYQINSNDAVVSSTTGDKSNKTVYKETISNIKKDDIVKLYSSTNRLAIFAIYATYEIDPLYVKFMVNGTKSDSITTTTGEKLGNLFIDGELPTPVVAGYTFNGWKNAANDAAVDKNTAVGENSMTIAADLSAIEYAVTIGKGDNAYTAGSATVHVNDEALTLSPEPTGKGLLLGYYTGTTATAETKVADAEGNLVEGTVAGYVTAGKWSRTEAETTLYAVYDGTTTALNDVENEVKAEKVLRNGQLFIEKAGKTYNAQGQLVK